MVYKAPWCDVNPDTISSECLPDGYATDLELPADGTGRRPPARKRPRLAARAKAKSASSAKAVFTIEVSSSRILDNRGFRHFDSEGGFDTPIVRGGSRHTDAAGGGGFSIFRISQEELQKKLLWEQKSSLFMKFSTHRH